MSEINFAEVDAPASTTPEPPAAEPEKTAPVVAALDAVFPDGEDIDEDLRGKPLKDVARLTKKYKEDVKSAYYERSEFNNLKSRAEMAEALLRVQQQQQRQPEQQIDPKQFVDQFVQNPTAVLQHLTRQEIEPITKELQSLKQEGYFARAELAREKARQAAGVDEETWETLTRPLASIIHASGGDPSIQKDWLEAYNNTFKAIASKISPKAQVTTQGQPPVGQARSAAAPRDNRPKLSARDEKNLGDLAGMFRIKKGTPAWDQLVKDIQNDPAAMGAYINE